MSSISFYPVNNPDDISFQQAVIVARYENRWVMCRHRDQNTWDLPSGSYKPGESALETAKRILYAETGITDAEFHIVGGYSWNGDGLLFFAHINTPGILPSDSNVTEKQLFEILPMDLTYKDAHQKLYDWVQNWLNMQASAGELWDVYDENRNPTGRVHRRGDYMREGDYHLTVHVWMRNSRGEFLLTKRSPNKGFPNKWETTGGSAIAGDDSLAAALREVREETGLFLKPECGKCIYQLKADNNFSDIWLFQQDFDLKDAVLLEGETCDIRYASVEELLKLDAGGLLVPYSYLNDLIMDFCS